MQGVQPIIARVVEEPIKTTSIADVLIGSLGLAGVMTLSALLLGAVLGGLLIWFKQLRARYNLEPVPDSEALRVTPSSTTP